MSDHERVFSPIQPPIQKAILSFSAPILFIEKGTSSQLTTVGATALFWQSIEGKFIVTAWHVWDEIRKRTAQSKNWASIGVTVGERVISLLDAEMIDGDEALDIAVIWSPRLQSADMANKAFYQTTTWPLSPPRNEEDVGFIGFPGQLRHTQSFKINCPSIYWQGQCIVTRYGSYRILGSEYQERVRVDHRYGIPPITDIGGISGAPVFALRNTKPHLIGFVKRGTEHAGLDSTIEIISIYRIQADGRIVRS